MLRVVMRGLVGALSLILATSSLSLYLILHFHLASISLANTSPESEIGVRIRAMNTPKDMREGTLTG
jgi:hypothetical protein